MPLSCCSTTRSKLTRLLPMRTAPPSSTRSGGGSAWSGSSFVVSAIGQLSCTPSYCTVPRCLATAALLDVPRRHASLHRSADGLAGECRPYQLGVANHEHAVDHHPAHAHRGL